MKNFVILKNEQLLGIMDIGEITDLYYKNETFKKGVENKEIIIYMRDDKATIGMINFQNDLDELAKRIRKHYKPFDKFKLRGRDEYK